MEMSDVVINREPVELFKVLKFEGLVGSGGEAKRVIGNGLVQLNGEVETQKRKKVVSGDVIEFNDTQMTLVLEHSTLPST